VFRPQYNHIICLTATPKLVFRLLPWIMAALLALAADDQPNRLRDAPALPGKQQQFDSCGSLVLATRVD
jgi:hypothetical protein